MKERESEKEKRIKISFMLACFYFLIILIRKMK